MGMDCTVVVEIRRGEGWDMLCIVPLSRDRNLFNKMSAMGHLGYPVDVDPITKATLDNMEDYGESWLAMERFMELPGSDQLAFIKKKIRKDCRVIYRFDW